MKEKKKKKRKTANKILEFEEEIIKWKGEQCKLK